MSPEGQCALHTLPEGVIRVLDADDDDVDDAPTDHDVIGVIVLQHRANVMPKGLIGYNECIKYNAHFDKLKKRDVDDDIEDDMEDDKPTFTTNR